MKNVNMSEREDGSFALEILAIEDWNGFESIAKYLENFFEASFSNKLDGPDARIWIGTIKGYEIKLYHDSYGNTIYMERSNKSILESIASDLDLRLG